MLQAAPRRPRAGVTAVTFGNSHEPVTGRGAIRKRRSSSYTYADTELTGAPRPGGDSPPPTGLAAQAELADESVIPFDVSTLEVVEQAPALRDHLEQPPARVVVLLVSLEVLGQLVDALGEQSDLHLRRAGVAFVRPVLVDDAFLYFRRCRHNCSRWPSQSAVEPVL